MQQKIKLVVQGAHEDAYEFSSTLESISKGIQIDRGLTEPPHIHTVTSSSNGRHSVMFTWVEGLGHSKSLWKQASDKPSKLQNVIVKLESGKKYMGMLNVTDTWGVYYPFGLRDESEEDKVIEWAEMP